MRAATRISCGCCCAGCFTRAAWRWPITLAAIYAEHVIGFKPSETMVLIFVLNLAAAAGAFGFGYYQDKIGHKLALGITLVRLDRHLHHRCGSRPPRAQFWWAAAIAGACMGSSAVGRPCDGRHVRAGESNLPSSMAYGPLRRGWPASSDHSLMAPSPGLTGGNQRVAILSTAVLFVAGIDCAAAGQRGARTRGCGGRQ